MQRNYAYIHRDGCGLPAFYLAKRPKSLSEALIEMPEGQQRDLRTDVKCGSCNKPLIDEHGCMDRNYVVAVM